MTDGFRSESIIVNTTGTTPAGATVAPARHGRRISWYAKNVSSGAAAAAIIDLFCGENKVLLTMTGDYNLDPKGHVNDSNEDKYKCFQGAIRAVSDIDGAKILISERIEI